MNSEQFLKIRKRKQHIEKDVKKVKKVKNVKEIDLKCYEKSDFLDFLDEKINQKPGLPPMCHCVNCFDYMGEMNPRQYCHKINCSYSDFSEDELLQTKVFNLRKSPYYNDSDFWGYKEYHDTIQKFIDDNYLPDLEDCMT